METDADMTQGDLAMQLGPGAWLDPAVRGSPRRDLDAADPPVDLDAGTQPVELDALTTELRVALGRLMRRLRREHRFPLTQALVLVQLDGHGQRSIGELAACEGVRPQSMSQTIGELEAEGLVERRPDATDGRRAQIAITVRGRAALDAYRAAREGWLGKQIAGFTPAEQEILRDAIVLFNRLADAG